jgi:branched-chain amino acid transport system ATP-binding protein
VALLDVVGLSAGYGPYRVLDDIHLEVAPGEVVGVLGANGAGKTTLARVLSGLVPASAGSVTLDGVAILRCRPATIVRHGLVHVNEGRAIFSSLTVEENLQLVGLPRGRAATRRILADAYDAFPALGEARRRPAGTLSGGEQRQLALMKALALGPRLLVADELSLGLSPSASARIYERLALERSKGLAMLIVESQLEHLGALADRATVLEHGAQRMTGTFADAVESLRASVSDRAGT